jgi:hypothetical protein
LQGHKAIGGWGVAEIERAGDEPISAYGKSSNVVIPAKAEPAPHLMRGIHNIYLVPGVRRDDVWIPGLVPLARNDDSTSPELSNSGNPPAEPGVHLNAN